jgi:hypothetical protein
MAHLPRNAEEKETSQQFLANTREALRFNEKSHQRGVDTLDNEDTKEAIKIQRENIRLLEKQIGSSHKN